MNKRNGDYNGGNTVINIYKKRRSKARTLSRHTEFVMKGISIDDNGNIQHTSTPLKNADGRLKPSKPDVEKYAKGHTRKVQKRKRK